MSIAIGSVFRMDRSAALYARISSDSEGQGLGVARQIADCTAEAGRRGWSVVDQYVDNDVSATRSKVRPEYQRMLGAIRAGVITALVVWDVDRLTRTPRELEDIIDLADRQGLALASVGGEIDLATPQGRMTARIKGTVARHETEQQSRRLKRKFQERAEAGKPHSFAAFGYRRRADGTDELDPEQAAVIRAAAAALLGGQSLRSVVAELNSAGRPSARGGPWSSTTLRQLLLRERNAGRRVHHGHVIGAGQWPAIYDAGTHDRVVSLLTDPARKTSKGSARRYLLSGIARCGLCLDDSDVIVNVGRLVTTKAGGTKRQPPAYICRRCTRIRRKQADVDEFVSGVMVARLTRPDALGALAAGDPAEVQRARDEVEALSARLDLAADQYADGGITGEQLRRITGRLRPQIDRARARIGANMPVPGVAQLTGTDAAEKWASAALDAKRTVIEMLCTVTILPSGPGRRFDPELVRIEWKGAR